VTKTTAFGTDIVVLDAANGGEVLRVTSDGRSWSPDWSPAGNAIAYLHQEGGITELRMVELEGSGPDWRVGSPLELTTVSGLDEASRPEWYISRDDLPVPGPQPTGEGPAASPGPATAPP
jgi:hypothetical protein